MASQRPQKDPARAAAVSAAVRPLRKGWTIYRARALSAVSDENAIRGDTANASAAKIRDRMTTV